MNRSGQLGDIAILILFGFIISVCFLIVWLVLGIWNDTVSTSTLFTQHSKDINEQSFGNFGTVFDNSFLMIYVGIVIASLVLSYVLRSNPGMFFAMLLIVFLFSIIAGYMGNAYTTFASDQGMQGAAASLPIQAFVMDNYLVFTLVNTILMIIVFFAKPNEGGGYA